MAVPPPPPPEELEGLRRRLAAVPETTGTSASVSTEGGAVQVGGSADGPSFFCIGEDDEAAAAAAAADAALDSSGPEAEAEAEANGAAAEGGKAGSPLADRGQVLAQTSFAAATDSAAARPKRAAAVQTPLVSAETWEKLNMNCAEIPVIKAVSEALSLSPVFVGSSSIAMLLAFLLYGFGGQLVCTLFGTLYPGFESFKALEHGRADAMQFWLMYWVVFSMLTSFEHVCYYILVWLPLYYPLKLGFLVWLFLPSTNGARYIYRWLVSPMLKKHQEHIDVALEESSKKIRRSISTGVSGAVSAGVGASLSAGTNGVATLRRAVSLAGPQVTSGLSALVEAAASARERKGSSSAATAAKASPASPTSAPSVPSAAATATAAVADAAAAEDDGGGDFAALAMAFEGSCSVDAFAMSGAGTGATLCGDGHLAHAIACGHSHVD